MSMIQSVCVYCGSSPGANPLYKEAATALGHALAQRGLDLVYGAGTKGLMGAVASAAQAKGAKVTGIIPRFLMEHEATQEELQKLDSLILTETMHERKALLFDSSDAFVVLPGGIGTLDEIVEMMTWAQLGQHTKPMVFANIAGFWEPLLVLLRHMREEGFLHNSDKIKILVCDAIGDIVPTLLSANSHA